MSFPVVNGLRGIEFGTKGEFRDELIALILQGKKKATAGTLEWDYRVNGEPIEFVGEKLAVLNNDCLLYTSPSPRDGLLSRMPSSA